jgi:hypothetical protein
MVWVRKWVALVAAAGMAAAPVGGWAADPQRVMNPEGRWGVEIDNDGCIATLDASDGSIFVVTADEGAVSLAVVFTQPVQPGKTGQIRTEAYDFDFTPHFTEGNEALFSEEDLGSQEAAVLRLAKQVRVLVDGREVSRATFENSGFGGVLDGLVACSQGQEGWWGKGVAGGGAPDEPPTNAEGYWTIRATGDPGYCMAAVGIDDQFTFMLVADAAGEMAFSVLSTKPIRHARKGEFRTDSFSFDFKPLFAEDDSYVYHAGNLDSQAEFALRRAKAAGVYLDGRELTTMQLEGTGQAQVMADLKACAAGENGWWGQGAAQP